MPRPTDNELDEQESLIFAKLKDARMRASTGDGAAESVNRAAMVAHLAAALASLRSIPRGAK